MLTVEENVVFPLRLTGTTAPIRRGLRRSLRTVELDGLRGQAAR